MSLDLRRFRGLFQTENSARKGEHCHEQTRHTHRSFAEKLSGWLEPPTQSIPSPGSPGRSVSPMAPFGALGQPVRDRLRRASGAHNRGEEGGATQTQAREVKTLRQERKRSSEKQPAFFAR